MNWCFWMWVRMSVMTVSHFVKVDKLEGARLQLGGLDEVEEVADVVDEALAEYVALVAVGVHQVVVLLLLGYLVRRQIARHCEQLDIKKKNELYFRTTSKLICVSSAHRCAE